MYSQSSLVHCTFLHWQDNKRRTLQRNDIAMAITKYDQFDFLIDIVPRDDIKPTTKREESSVRMVPDQVPLPRPYGRLWLPTARQYAIPYSLLSRSCSMHIIKHHIMLCRWPEPTRFLYSSFNWTTGCYYGLVMIYQCTSESLLTIFLLRNSDKILSLPHCFA